MDCQKDLVWISMLLLVFTARTFTAFETEPFNWTALLGDDIEFNCIVDPGANFVFWKFNRTEILSVNSDLSDASLQDKYEIKSDAEREFTLKVFDVEPENDGLYECQDRQQSQEHYLTVNIKPTVTLAPSERSLEVEVGASLTVDCSVTGKPSPSVQWNKLPVSKDVGVYPGTLLSLSPVQEVDAGDYQCEAQNEAGKASRTFTLIVRYKPRVTVMGEETYVHKGPGDDLEITCVFKASPEPIVHWLRDGQMVDARGNVNIMSYIMDNELRSTLSITGITRQDYGVYNCTGHNDWGHTHSLVTLSGIPEITSLNSGGRQEYINQYTIQWKVQSKPRLDYYHLVLTWTNESTGLLHERNDTLSAGDLSLTDSTGMHYPRYNIPHLQENATYSVKLRAKNTVGISQWSDAYTFTTPAEGKYAETSDDNTVIDEHVPDSGFNGCGPMRSGVTTVLAAILVLISSNLLL